ncbi:SPOR domain-containing protein [Flavobacterium sp.]|uniref:SPOR domain-containing protein n=1 Tax=Flavobacterium sp. TaxID=239 RepID=UPI0026134269|nr:SPOR domain-containing protein [Flavobacterium sp.]
MRKLKFGRYLFVALFLITGSGYMHAQDVTVTQDEKFVQLLNEKRKINASVTINDKYKIQIFYGENDKARKALSEFKREFTDTDGTIVYESPTYKVWVGSFSSRIDAERMLVKVKERFPYALLIKPNK